MNIAASSPALTPSYSPNRRPGDPGLSPAEDPVDTCTFGRTTGTGNDQVATWGMQMSLLRSKYGEQRQSAGEVLDKAKKGMPLSGDEEEAMRALAVTPQANGSAQVAVSHKTEVSAGPAKGWTKVKYGYETSKGSFASTQVGTKIQVGEKGGPSGTLSSSTTTKVQNGVTETKTKLRSEVSGELAGYSGTLYTETTSKAGQSQPERQTGVEVGKSWLMKMLSLSADFSNRGVSVGAKAEIPLGGAHSVGVETSANLPTDGNARAREMAYAALQKQTSNETSRILGVY